MPLSLSKDAQTYLDSFEDWDPDSFEDWDPESTHRRSLWAKISPDERDQIHAELRNRMHAKNAAHAVKILQDLPENWRDVVIDHFRIK